jgi:hypothetical protein
MQHFQRGVQSSNTAALLARLVTKACYHWQRECTSTTICGAWQQHQHMRRAQKRRGWSPKPATGLCQPQCVRSHVVCVRPHTNKGEGVEDVGWQQCSGKASHGSVHCMSVPQDSLPLPEYYTQCTVLRTVHSTTHSTTPATTPTTTYAEPRCQHKQKLLAARQQRLPKCFQSILWQQAAGGLKTLSSKRPGPHTQGLPKASANPL